MASLKIDLAIGEQEMTVALPDGAGSLTVPVALRGSSDEPGPALLQAFGRLEEALRESERLPKDALSGHVRVRAALLPPLCDVRLVTLPPLRPEELQAVLRRDAARHFLGSARALVAAGERFGEGSSERPPPVFAAAAPRALVDALQRAVESRGWELERVVPAHAAWLRALEKAAPAQPAAADRETSRVRVVLAVVDGTAHLVRLVGDTPDQIRRVPAADTQAVVEAAGPNPGWLLLLAEEPLRRGFASALKEAGWMLAQAGEAQTAVVEAARHAASASPELVPAPLAWARKERSRRLTVRMLGASVLTLAAAAVVHLVGTVREYRSVRQERAELSDLVAPALAARDSLDRMSERLLELETLGRESARWTFSLVELSVLLPEETHLISLRAAGDTAVVEAEGGRAGDALAALRTATTLEDVKLEGAIQRDIEGGTTSRERFTLSAVLAPPKALRPVPPLRDSTNVREGP